MVGMRTRRCLRQRRRQAFQPSHTCLAQALGVGHDVRLADGHEIGRIEEFADGDLMANGPLADRPLLASEHSAFFIGQAHGSLPLRSASNCACHFAAAAASLRTGVMRSISLSTSFCSASGPRSAALRRRAAQLDVALDSGGIVEGLVQCGGQLVDDLLWSALGRHHRIPGAENEVDACLLGGGHVGQAFESRGCGNRHRP